MVNNVDFYFLKIAIERQKFCQKIGKAKANFVKRSWKESTNFFESGKESPILSNNRGKEEKKRVLLMNCGKNKEFPQKFAVKSLDFKQKYHRKS